MAGGANNLGYVYSSGREANERIKEIASLPELIMTPFLFLLSFSLLFFTFHFLFVSVENVQDFKILYFVKPAENRGTTTIRENPLH